MPVLSHLRFGGAPYIGLSHKFIALRHVSLQEISEIPVFTLTVRSISDTRKFSEFNDSDESISIHQLSLTQCRDLYGLMEAVGSHFG